MGAAVRLVLALPADRSSVPLVRRMLDAPLGTLGVSSDCRADIGLAVGEACANVIRHAGGGGEYEVSVVIDGYSCTVDVGGNGAADIALVAERVTAAGAAGPDEESWRGLRIIQALVDVVELRRRTPDGAALHIVKLLQEYPSAAVQLMPPATGRTG